MVAVLVAHVAVHAQIVVLTRETGHKLLLREALDTAITSACRLIVRRNRLLLVGVSSRKFPGLFSLNLGWDALGGAVQDGAVLDGALHHPVAGTRAVDTRIDASGAEIVIAAVTNAAVEMVVLHGMVAVVAIYHPGSAGARLGPEGESSIRLLVGRGMGCLHC
jgi:hypothetical protein